MSSFSGISAILTVSLVALVTVQMLKDKFEMVENYGEVDEDGVQNYQGDYMQSYTANDEITNNMIHQQRENIPVMARNLSNQPGHDTNSFVPGSSAFVQPFVAPNADANGWNAFPQAYEMFQAQIAASEPTAEQLNAISSVQNLPGPIVFNNDYFAQANVNTGRAANLSLCSQNLNMNPGSASIASSLLPQPGLSGEFEGFSDCNPNTNGLANQVFLLSSGQIGTDTVGSVRNANLDLRSAPPNPVLPVGPWNNSTIYPDLLRRPLEGCGPSFGLYGNGPNSAVTPSNIMQ
jgi:hypothetical protein